MSLSDPVLSVILMCAIAALIGALVVYVIASYDSPSIWHEDEEEWVRVVGPVPDRPYNWQDEPGA
jgi:hypothetical protein